MVIKYAVQCYIIMPVGPFALDVPCVMVHKALACKRLPKDSSRNAFASHNPRVIRGFQMRVVGLPTGAQAYIGVHTKAQKQAAQQKSMVLNATLALRQDFRTCSVRDNKTNNTTVTKQEKEQ